MKYAKIKPNDVANGEGVVVSLWTQGCPHRCKGCQNPETWNFNKGKVFTDKDRDYIIECLTKNNIKRDFSVLGGEPLCSHNVLGVLDLCKYIKDKIPGIRIYVWTGYLFENLIKFDYIKEGLKHIDILIDGKYIEENKDLTLKLRGSNNQRIIDVDKSLKENKVFLY